MMGQDPELDGQVEDLLNQTRLRSLKNPGCTGASPLTRQVRQVLPQFQLLLQAFLTLEVCRAWQP